jgi:hypothetical protein
MSKSLRHAGQKIAFAAAIFCLLLVLPALGGFAWMWLTRGLADTWTPSALALVAFLICCAGVFYAMGRPTPPLPEEDSAAGS